MAFCGMGQRASLGLLVDSGRSTAKKTCIQIQHKIHKNMSKQSFFDLFCMCVWLSHLFISISLFPSPGYITDWWFGTFGLFFHSVGNFIIPTDELHHFSDG